MFWNLRFFLKTSHERFVILCIFWIKKESNTMLRIKHSYIRWHAKYRSLCPKTRDSRLDETMEGQNG